MEGEVPKDMVIENPTVVEGEAPAQIVNLVEEGGENKLVEEGRKKKRSMVWDHFTKLPLVETNSDKSELERYLAEDTIDDTVDFDILCWWKANSSKYRILSTIAHDVLAVQVSTVASESCFSTSGRVLDAFRSSLSPKMVEALICTQNWLNPVGLKFDEDDFQIFDTTEKIVDDVCAKIVESQGENEMQQVS